MEGFYDQSKEARKKNVLHVTTKNYLGNILCKFLIKFESTWRCEIKEHTPLWTPWIPLVKYSSPWFNV